MQIVGRRPHLFRASRMASIALVLAAAGSFVPPTASATPGRSVAPGVSVSRLRLPGPVRLVVVRLDPSLVRLVPALATDRLGGYGVLREVAHAEHALIAINGDLASPDRPAHAIVLDGELLTSGREAGAVFALDPTGTRAAVTVPRVPVIATRLDTGESVRIARWNAGEAPDDGMVAFTALDRDPSWSSAKPCSVRLDPTIAGPTLDRYRVAAVVCDGFSVPRATGDEVVLTAGKGGAEGHWIAGLRPGVRIGVRASLGLPEVDQAFGGYPLLVHEGRVVHGPCLPMRCDLHPRSGVGLTRGCLDETTATRCAVLLVTADGRREGWSIGMTTEGFARVLTDLGAWEALNLDGGASTQLLLGDRSLNRPAPGARRAVVNALIVRAAGMSPATGWSPRIAD